MSVQIRPVEGDQWRICRALLPQGCQYPGLRDGFLAWHGTPSRPAGASVVSYHDRDAWLHTTVVEPVRRQGIASTLWGVVHDAALRRGALRVVAMSGDSKSDGFLAAQGFREGLSWATFEAETGALFSFLDNARYLRGASSRVPSSVRFGRVSDAPPGQVAELYAEHLMQTRDPASARSIEDDPGRWKDSPALLVDGRLRGMVLLDSEGAVAKVHAKIVSPELRGGWANAVLTEHMADAFQRLRATRFRFEARSDNADTRKFARRMNAVTLATQRQFEFPLPQHAPLDYLQLTCR